MVAFGSDLDISGKVDGAIEGVYCYKYTLNDCKAIITGIDKTLKEWIIGVKVTIIKAFAGYQGRKKVPDNEYIEIVKNESMKYLYYRQEKSVALPDIQIGSPIKEVIDSCIDIIYRKMKIDISINISDIVDRCFNSLSIPNYQSESCQFNSTQRTETRYPAGGGILPGQL